MTYTLGPYEHISVISEDRRLFIRRSESRRKTCYATYRRRASDGTWWRASWSAPDPTYERPPMLMTAADMVAIEGYLHKEIENDNLQYYNGIADEVEAGTFGK